MTNLGSQLPGAEERSSRSVAFELVVLTCCATQSTPAEALQEHTCPPGPLDLLYVTFQAPLGMSSGPKPAIHSRASA